MGGNPFLMLKKVFVIFGNTNSRTEITLLQEAG
jgi:hypothetical protein